MEKLIKKHKKDKESELEREQVWRDKIFKELQTMIHLDYGDACEVWDEECMICQVYKAYSILKESLNVKSNG